MATAVRGRRPRQRNRQRRQQLPSLRTGSIHRLQHLRVRLQLRQGQLSGHAAEARCALCARQLRTHRQRAFQVRRALQPPPILATVGRLSTGLGQHRHPDEWRQLLQPLQQHLWRRWPRCGLVAPLDRVRAHLPAGRQDLARLYRAGRRLPIRGQAVQLGRRLCAQPDRPDRNAIRRRQSAQPRQCTRCIGHRQRHPVVPGQWRRGDHRLRAVQSLVAGRRRDPGNAGLHPVHRAQHLSVQEQQRDRQHHRRLVRTSRRLDALLRPASNTAKRAASPRRMR